MAGRVKKGMKIVKAEVIRGKDLMKEIGNGRDVWAGRVNRGIKREEVMVFGGRGLMRGNGE